MREDKKSRYCSQHTRQASASQAHFWRVLLARRQLVKYTKRALTVDEQADRLLGRGLVADRNEPSARPRSVSYYRLSGYWYPFRLSDDSFVEGTTLEAVWRRCTFDRQFRLLVLDAVERVEICVRTELVYTLAHAQGPFGYGDAANLPNLSAESYGDFVDKLDTEGRRSREPFIQHFREKYGSEHDRPPCRMATELMTFGMPLTLFRGSPTSVKRDIARRFGVSSEALMSWLRALNGVSSTCAHHGRLWNRELGLKPKIPNKDARWHDPVEVSNNRLFGILTILKYLLDEVAPQSQRPQRLAALCRLSGDPTDAHGLPRAVVAVSHLGRP